MGVAAALLAGGALSAAGSIMQGDAAAAAAKANIKALQRERDLRNQQSREAERRDRSTNITLIAKSGVRQTGSPAAVLVANAANAETARLYADIETQQQVELLRVQRGNVRISSAVTAGGQLLGAAGQAGAHSARN